MNKPQTSLEFGQHLAKMVTPKDINGYWRILSDNEKFIAHEVEAHVQQRCAALVEALECIMQGGGMLNQPAAMNGPDDAWLRRRISHYESIAYTALAQFKGEK